jgi:hypothetical protein
MTTDCAPKTASLGTSVAVMPGAANVALLRLQADEVTIFWLVTAGVIDALEAWKERICSNLLMAPPKIALALMKLIGPAAGSTRILLAKANETGLSAQKSDAAV